MIHISVELLYIHCLHTRKNELQHKMNSLQKCIKLPISSRLPAMTGLHVGYT